MRRRKKFSQQEITRERWLRGRLDYKLHEGQKIIRANYRSRKKQLFVGEMARQFGKSFLMVVDALETAMRKANARIKYGTAFYTDLIEFILPTFDTVLEDCPPDIKPVYKVQGGKFCCYNGSEIKLVGLDRKPNGLRGNVIDGVYLDEAGFMSRLDYIYRSVIIPATTHRPDCKVLVFSSSPDTPAHEFLDYVARAELEGGYEKFTIYQNPLVDEATIQRLMDESGGPNSTTWRREYLCEHVTDANLAIVAEWDDKYFVEVPRDDYYPFYLKYVSMDLGIGDFTAVLFGYYDFLKAKLIIEDELVVNGPELTTDIIQLLVKLKELNIWNGADYGYGLEDILAMDQEDKEEIEEEWLENQPKTHMKVSDSNNPLLLQDLSYLHKLHFSPTDKGSLEEMVNAVKMMVRSGSILVHPRCKQTRGCLKYGIWDKNRQKFASSKVYGHFDALAALIYLVRNLNKAHNPIPQDFQVDHSNQIIITRDTQSESAERMKKAFKLGGRR